MPKWEYRRVLITYEDEDWVARLRNREINGFQRILNYHGNREWELVALIAHEWHEPSDSRTFRRELIQEVRAYYAIFKRPKE